MNSFFNTVAVVTLAALFSGCASISSGPDTDSLAFERSPQGVRELKPNEARDYAYWALPFARVATHVYCRYLTVNDPENKKVFDCMKFPELSATGWELLYDWRSILTEADGKSNLEFMAFGRVQPDRKGEIIIGFKGTDFTSLYDWRSNLRWVTHYLPLPGHDAYQTVHSHAQQIVDLAFEKAKEKFPSAVDFKAYSTGHSLGGGLAQLLAYTDDRLVGAVVFDSSPVTGYSSLVSDAQINCNAQIVRIYERGEVLQYARSVLRRVRPLSANIREVSFDLIHARGNGVVNHSMPLFRAGLEARANVGQRTPVQITALPDAADCECYLRRRPKDRSAQAAACYVPVKEAMQ